MVKGLFIGNIPWVQATIAAANSVQNPHFILDTGFTGDLKVTPKIATDLGLQPTSVMRTRIANGSIATIPTALAVASIEGVVRVVNVLIADGSPLAGIGLLKKYGYKASVCCKYNTVELEKDH